MDIRKKILAAKILKSVVTISLVTSSFISSSSQAGIPVVDGTNLSQNILSAVEAVAQTAKQIQQYQLQLQQYENQLKNTLVPKNHVWDQAQATISDLTQATNTLAYYQQQLGSLNAYLGKYQDVTFYRNSPCFSGAECTSIQRDKILENQRLASESQKKANDALILSLSKQQQYLESDAQQLVRLQAAAQGADGQLAAIGYSNQLASSQINQLLQIRSLLIAQQNAFAAQIQSQSDKEALHQASREHLFEGLTSSVDRSISKAY